MTTCRQSVEHPLHAALSREQQIRLPFQVVPCVGSGPLPR